MSIQVRPSELKTIAKLSGQIKDISLNTKNYTWSSLHRLVVKEGWLHFYTNDGQIFLEWLIPLEDISSDNYEIVVPAVQFNDLVSKSLVGFSYQINYHGGLLELSQGRRKLKIRTELRYSYPDPTLIKSDDPTWLITASLLHKNLAFVAPFIDESNAKSSQKVATWTSQGDLVGGTLQLMVQVQGLPVPLVPMNFTKKAAKALVAFLSVLEGDVQITVSEKHYYFDCPVCYHRLIIVRETVSFREPLVRKGTEMETFKVDGSRLLSGVRTLEAMLPKDKNRLLFKICGNGENAIVKIFTAMDESKSSHDEISIARETASMNGSDLPDTQLSVNSKFLSQALREMDRVLLTLKYYHKNKLLYIEDECRNDTGTHRVVMMVVNSEPSFHGGGLAELKKALSGN